MERLSVVDQQVSEKNIDLRKGQASLLEAERTSYLMVRRTFEAGAQLMRVLEEMKLSPANPEVGKALADVQSATAMIVAVPNALAKCHDSVRVIAENEPNTVMLTGGGPKYF
ncbi:MAG: hypothetical protein AAGC56_07350 [Pseudomonadota bacterium]